MFSKTPKTLTITSKKVVELIKRKGWVDNRRPPLWLILDQSFVLASDKQIRAVIDADKTDEKPYIPNSGDCDNYAFELRNAFGRRGWAVGFIAVDTGTPPLHAIFFYINDELEVIPVEPQNDKVFDKKFKLVAVEMH